jgi:hypothetical protein
MPSKTRPKQDRTGSPASSESHVLTRRSVLSHLALAGLAAPFYLRRVFPRFPESLALASQLPSANSVFSAPDDALLDAIERASCLFFWEQAGKETGLVKDRARANGRDTRKLGSIASTGFGLTALCIADSRGYLPSTGTRERVRTTLRFLVHHMTHVHGFFYHWADIDSGARILDSELSSIDSSLLLCGVLICREHFDDPEIKHLATTIYDRVDWPWMLAGGKTLSMGWKPEGGFLKARWNTYSELMMIYLLGLGSTTHPLPAATWHAWKRPIFHYDGLTYIGSDAPLFINQYSHAWFDFRDKRDEYANYFHNSILATEAHKRFCVGLHSRFPDYSDSLWGISASDSQHGYVAWGGPPAMGPIDGTVVPCAAGGSLPFLPHDTMRVLRTMRKRFGEHAWKRYGFVDAFNPLTGWFDQDVIGIDLGITVLMAENARSNFVWNTFMKNPEARRGMERAGFHSKHS